MAEGLNAVIVNPSIVVGPGDWDRSSSYLFSVVWKGIKFYSNGVTGYVDIRDVVRSMIYIMHSEVTGERYTVTSENLTFRQVLEMIANALGKKPPGIHAGPFLLSIAWRLDWFLCKLTGKNRSITRDAAKSSHRKSFFSNEKIREVTGIDFLPVEQSIKDTALLFLKQHSA
jgi:nucleoside-diphosphate-sugar epimerase